MKRRVITALAGLIAACAACGAWAQYPEKPVRIVVPYSPGSGTDLFLRTVAEPLSRAFGQSVVVENRPGANTALAAEVVAKAAPDGYTLLATTNAIVANPAGILRSVNYDVIKDYTPITRLGSATYVLVVQSAKPWKTVGELLDHVRANPGKLNYASGNVGGILYMEMLKKSTGVQMVHVPYKSPPLALADLLGGQVQMMFSDQATAFIQANAGKVRALVSTSLRRSPLFLQVPTLAEAGIGGIPDMPGWWALYGPAGLRKDHVERINREVNVILQRPEIREKLLTVGIEMMGSTPEELATFTREQLQHYVRLLKEFNIKPD